MKKLRNILAVTMFLLSADAVCAMPAGAEAPQQRVEVAAVPVVKVVNSHVEIHLPGDENRQVTVFALTGQVVRTVVATPGVTVIDLPAGSYIVTCARHSQRVIGR